MNPEQTWAAADRMRDQIVNDLPSVWSEGDPRKLHPIYLAMAQVFQAEAATVSEHLHYAICSFFRDGATNSPDAFELLRAQRGIDPRRMLAALQLLHSTITR
jgi:hypothetical protein